jgi:hypothetical protein
MIIYSDIPLNKLKEYSILIMNSVLLSVNRWLDSVPDEILKHFLVHVGISKKAAYLCSPFWNRP